MSQTVYLMISSVAVMIAALATLLTAIHLRQIIQIVSKWHP